MTSSTAATSSRSSATIRCSAALRPSRRVDDPLSPESPVSPAPRLSILVLGDNVRSHADTLQHLAAFLVLLQALRRLLQPPRRRVEQAPRPLRMTWSSSTDPLAITVDAYLSPVFREQIRRFEGLKVQLLQDEYRWVDSVTETMRYLGIDVLLSIVPEDQIAAVYGDRIPDTEILPTLAGYVPEKLSRYQSPPLAGRPIDVGYRGRALPFWNGRLSQEKVWIAQGVLQRIRGTALRTTLRGGSRIGSTAGAGRGSHLLQDHARRGERHVHNGLRRLDRRRRPGVPGGGDPRPASRT